MTVLNASVDAPFPSFQTSILPIFRIKSAVATRFCIWATQRLREYIVKAT
jgi:hypothetical protein